MHERTTGDAAPAADRHLVFSLLSVSMLIYVMQFGMVAVALGELTDDLDAPLRWSGWVLTMFMVGQVVALPVTGRLSERFGARQVFAIGLACFSLASLACAAAPNVFVLIAARGLQGAAGGGLIPSGTSLIGETYGAGRTKAIALFSSILPFGAVFGPSLGGLIVDHLGWRWTFAFNVPLGLLGFVLALLLLPSGARRPVERIDLRGIGLIAVVITSVVFALTELGQRKVSPDYRLVAGAVAVFAVGLFVLVRHELRTRQPAIDLDLLRRREFAATNLVAFSFGMSWIGAATMIPLYVQESYGLSITASGALMSPRAAVMVVVSSVAALAITRTGFRRPIFVGMIGVSGSLAVLAVGLHEPSIGAFTMPNFWWLLIVIGVAGGFFGLANPSLNNASLELAPDRIAAVAGLRGMFMTLGGTLGIALVVLVASRAETVPAGLEIGFAVLALILIISTIFVFAIPELGSGSATMSPPPPASEGGELATASSLPVREAAAEAARRT